MAIISYRFNVDANKPSECKVRNFQNSQNIWLIYGYNIRSKQNRHIKIEVEAKHDYASLEHPPYTPVQNCSCALPKETLCDTYNCTAHTIAKGGSMNKLPPID